MKPAAVTPNLGHEPPSASMKFTYASGSKPLDGYTIKRGVGHGGFGEVYYATSDSGKEVALKLVRRNLDIELRGVQQCLNLKHPNLIGLYDIRRDSHGDSWVVMEYVGGEGLDAVLGRHPEGLLREDALAWFHGLAAAVAYLHDRGIVHRDLKPGNIFREDGIVKLGDYGLSKFISVSRRSEQTESVGTVHYMAPEIANGRYGKEIDIYALGILLYELLTGHVPFEGESVGEVLMKHLTAEPDLGRVAESYRAAIAACLAKDPRSRPQSVADLLRRLSTHEGAGAIGRVPVTATLATAGASPSAEPYIRPLVIDTNIAEPQFAGVPGHSSSRPASASSPPRSSPHGAALPHSSEVPHKPAEQNAAGWPRMAGRWYLMVLVVFCGLIFVSDVARTRGVGATRVGWLAAITALGGLWYLSRSPGRYQPAGANPSTAFPAAAPPPPPPRPAARQPSIWFRRDKYAEPVAALPHKTRRERAADLAGSLLLAALVSVVSLVVMSVLRGVDPEPEQVMWLGLVSTFGAWLVLVPAKFWEGRTGDSGRRRFVMLILGLILGTFACGLDQFLLVDLPYEGDAGAASLLKDIEAEVTKGEPSTAISTLAKNSYGPDGQPLLTAYLAYFGLLMLIVRWWHLADPLRRNRVSLWKTFLCVLWGLLIHALWPFPQPWATMIVLSMALSVQLSSPWLGRPRAAHQPMPRR